MELEQKEGSKLAKICQFFALKQLKLHFLKKFPRFDFTAFFCDFLCIRPMIIHWQSSWNRTGVVGGMHGWREQYTTSTLNCLPSSLLIFHWSPCCEACSKLKGCPSIFGSKWSVNNGDSQDISSIRLLERLGDFSTEAETFPFLDEFDSFIFFLEAVHHGCKLLFLVVTRRPGSICISMPHIALS